MMGGFRLPGLKEKSLLGDESRDEGLEDSERGEMGLGWRPLGESSETQKSINLLTYKYILISIFDLINFRKNFSVQFDSDLVMTCCDDEGQS